MYMYMISTTEYWAPAGHVVHSTYVYTYCIVCLFYGSIDVPLLGAEPDLVKLYSTHSGRHQLFREGGVTTAPNIREIYSYEQLLDGLAVLILNNLQVRRWIFKIDHYIQGKGIGT